MTSLPQPPTKPTEPTGHADHDHADHDHAGPGHDHVPPQGHSHGHSHGHGPAAPVSKHLRKVIAAVLIPFAAAVFVGMVVLWPGGAPAHERSGVGFDRQTQQGRVVALEQVDCKSVNASQVPPTSSVSTPEGREARAAQTGECKKATIEVATGSDKGRTFFEIVQPGAPGSWRTARRWSSRTRRTRPGTSSTPWST